MRVWEKYVLGMTWSLWFLHTIVTIHQFLSGQMWICSLGVCGIPLKWCHTLMDNNRITVLCLFFYHSTYLIRFLEDAYFLPQQMNNFNTHYFMFSRTHISCGEEMLIRCSDVSPQWLTAAPAPMLCLVSAAWPAEPTGVGLSTRGCSWSETGGGVGACGGGGRSSAGPEPQLQAEKPVLSQPLEDEQTELPQQQNHAGPPMRLCFFAQWWHTQRHSQCEYKWKQFWCECLLLVFFYCM